MERRVFKYILSGCILFMMHAVQAQNKPSEPLNPSAEATPKFPEWKMELSEKLKNLDQKLAELDFEKPKRVLAGLDVQLKDLGTQLNDLDRNLSESFKGFEENLGELYPAQLTEKTKTISRTYKVNSKDKLSIDNQYGNVSINTWPKNEIKVEVIIKAFENSESNAQSLLDGVTIQEDRQNNIISFKTSIERGKTIWRMFPGGNREKRGVQVNYEIFMPAKNPLDISNKYGSITVPDFAGKLNINSSYGSFSGQHISNPESKITSKYGSASIETLKSGNINVSYGSLKIENAQALQADVSYASVKIGRLSGSNDLNIKYCGKCRIEEIDKDLKELTVNAAYSSLALGFAPAANFNFDVLVNYAGFKFNDSKINITSQTPDNSAKGFHPEKNYKGKYGSGSDSTIKIVSNYGSVQFL